jgi:hypothetical protein
MMQTITSVWQYLKNDKSETPEKYYIYKGLTNTATFRLLQLLPGVKDEPLLCRLIEAQHDHAPEYALVLRRTQDSTTRRHRLKEVTTDTVLHISDADFRGLYILRARLVHHPLTLWMDSVCIDHSSRRDVSRHIAQLPQIIDGAISGITHYGASAQWLFRAPPQNAAHASSAFEARTYRFYSDCIHDLRTTFNPTDCVYSPLQHPDSIRVLQILPGTGDAISCKLLAIRRGELTYEALSYAWGEAIFSEHIHETRTGISIPVTKNLYHALRTFRHCTQNRILWVDAICIDQSSVEERNHQVKNMAQTYTQANAVIVWLGQQPCRQIIHSFASISSYLAGSQPHRLDYSQYGSSGDEDVDELSNAMTFTARQRKFRELVLACDIAELVSFLGRAWFTRVWVVQEFLLGKEVLFFMGDDTISLHSLEESLTLIHAHEHVLGARYAMLWQDLWESYSRNMRSVRALLACRALIDRSKKRTSRSLHQCCRMLIGRSCSDDRDKVYAAIGLAKDDLAIIPDYNLSFHEVCLDFARKSLLSGDFSVLHYASTSWLEPSRELAASFVPRLDSQQSHESPSPLGGLDTPRYCAGIKRKPAVRLGRPITVNIRGLRIDAVYHVESSTIVGGLRRL